MIALYILAATALVMGVFSIFSPHHRKASVAIILILRMLVMLFPYVVVMTLAVVLAYCTKWMFQLSAWIYGLAGAREAQ